MCEGSVRVKGNRWLAFLTPDSGHVPYRPTRREPGTRFPLCTSGRCPPYFRRSGQAGELGVRGQGKEDWMEMCWQT